MAANPNLTDYLETVLGLTANQRNAVIGQGLTTFRSFDYLNDKDIDKIADGIRKPGGTIANPRANVAGQPAEINNPGTEIGFIHVMRLKMLRYYCAYMDNVQRTIVPGEATLERLTQLWDLKAIIEDEGNIKIDLPEVITNTDDFRTTKEDLDNYLRRKRGSNDRPLAYVVRENSALPILDIGFGMPTYDDEMIQRAPHTGATYQQDNTLVWQVIRHMTHGGPAWNWVSTYARSMDGRSAYFAMRGHYQGESFQSRLKAQADAVLESTIYDGRARNFTFERFCEKLNKAFEDLDETGEPTPEARKIRVFLRGIRDPRLDTAKAQVMATAALNENFQAAVNYISQYLATSNPETTTRSRNVSAAERAPGRNGDGARGRGRGRGRNDSRGGRGHGRNGRGRGGGRQGAGRTTERYYSNSEWAALPNEERQRIRDARNGQDRRRSVSFVAQVDSEDRNVRQRNSDNDSSVMIQMPEQRNTGAVMSQRRTSNQL